jgi:hypothetical protein
VFKTIKVVVFWIVILWLRSRDVVVGVVTGLRAGRSGFESRRGQEVFSKMSRLTLGRPASYSLGTDYFTGGIAAGGVTLTTHLHLVPRVRLSGVMSLLRLCAFTLCGSVCGCHHIRRRAAAFLPLKWRQHVLPRRWWPTYETTRRHDWNKVANVGIK